MDDGADELRRSGFSASTAALQAFRADPLQFDALVTDERMPGLSGAALIKEVRAIRSGIPILLVSGYIGGKVTLDALDAGADEVLKKPLLARELARSLSRVFSAPGERLADQRVMPSS